MTKEILIDNWALQDIGSLFRGGLSHEPTEELYIDRDNDTHVPKKLPFAIIQLEALVDFLNNIIFRDQVIVDDRYIGAWIHDSPTLKSLYQKGFTQLSGTA